MIFKKFKSEKYRNFGKCCLWQVFILLEICLEKFGEIMRNLHYFPKQANIVWTNYKKYIAFTIIHVYNGSKHFPALSDIFSKISC